jgi:hypothetical protein
MPAFWGENRYRSFDDAFDGLLIKGARMSLDLERKFIGKNLCTEMMAKTRRCRLRHN